MKIEKLNENQIRCTLTKEDLQSRKIKLSELAYGSEKAKTLFRDMMKQAADDFGFEVNNTPLMIEAIPMSIDTIILIITKVDDPDELDSRFSRFSLDDNEPEDDRPSLSPEELTGADDILNLIQKLHQAKKDAVNKAAEKESANHDTVSTAKAASDSTKQKDVNEDADMEAQQKIYQLTRFYLFHDLETVIRAARVLPTSYQGPNVLFKNPEDNHYYLILKKADTSAETFNRICNILSEYAMQVNYTPGMEEFFTEHMQVMIPANAIQNLSTF